VKIIAMDPGVANFAFSVVTDQPDIPFIGQLENPIQSIKKDDLEVQVCCFKWEIDTLISKIGLAMEDRIVVERYQPRGPRNPQIELVNVMIGIIADKFEHQLILITPAVWKNYIKKQYGTNKMTQLLKEKSISPHIKDSIGLASYIFERYYNKPVLKELIDGRWISSCQK